MIASRIHPATEGHYLSLLFDPQFTARMSPQLSPQQDTVPLNENTDTAWGCGNDEAAEKGSSA
jgi:hypothetical protein